MAKEAEWVARVQAWRASGLSRREFIKDKGYAATSLSWWATELKRRAVAVESVPMVRVVARPVVDAAVTVEVGCAKVVVRRGFDEVLLREVIAALGAK